MLENGNNIGLQQKLQVYGTPSYIPPEILRGANYDKKSDIFSIGSILFNLLTGMNLFVGNTFADLLKQNKMANFEQA